MALPLRFAATALSLAAAAGLVLLGPAGNAWAALPAVASASGLISTSPQKAPEPRDADEAPADRPSPDFRALALDVVAMLRDALALDGRDGGPSQGTGGDLVASRQPMDGHGRGGGMLDTALTSEMGPMIEMAGLDVGIVAFRSGFLGTGQGPPTALGGALQPAASAPPRLPGDRGDVAGRGGLLFRFLAGLRP